MQDEGVLFAAGEGRDGTLDAGYNARTDERGDADTHGARFGSVPAVGLGSDSIESGKRGIDPGQDCHAEGGGSRPVRGALEDPIAQSLLQAADGAGQRRLSKAVLPGGRTEGAGPSDRLSIAQALRTESVVHTDSLRKEPDEGPVLKDLRLRAPAEALLNRPRRNWGNDRPAR